MTSCADTLNIRPIYILLHMQPVDQPIQEAEAAGHPRGKDVPVEQDHSTATILQRPCIHLVRHKATQYFSCAVAWARPATSAKHTRWKQADLAARDMHSWQIHCRTRLAIHIDSSALIQAGAEMKWHSSGMHLVWPLFPYEIPGHPHGILIHSNDLCSP